MKSARLGILCLGFLLPILAGCGSSGTPTFSVSCITHRGPSGRIRADVTVTNSTSSTADAILFGPVFFYLTQVTPVVLRPTRVTLERSQGKTSYFAFTLPGVRPNKPSRLVLRFLPPPAAQPIAVTNVRVIQSSDSNVLQNPNCLIP